MTDLQLSLFGRLAWLLTATSLVLGILDHVQPGHW